MREVLEMVFDDSLHQFAHLAFRLPLDLQQQTFLQVSGSDAGRIKGLEKFKELFYLSRRHVDAVIDSQFVRDVVEAFPQQSVTVERSDQVFHDRLLLFGEFQLTHLLLQFVVERCRVAPHHLFPVSVVSTGTAVVRGIGRGHCVVASQILKGTVQGILTLLALRFHLVVLLIAVTVSIGQTVIVAVTPSKLVRLMVVLLQCRVVIKLSIDVLLKLSQGHLQQFHLQHLLL